MLDHHSISQTATLVGCSFYCCFVNLARGRLCTVGDRYDTSSCYALRALDLVGCWSTQRQLTHLTFRSFDTASRTARLSNVLKVQMPTSWNSQILPMLPRCRVKGIKLPQLPILPLLPLLPLHAHAPVHVTAHSIPFHVCTSFNFA